MLGAYLLLYPQARVLTLLPLGFVLTTVEVPAVLFLGVWFLFQLWQGGGFSLVAPEAAGGIAFFAYVGGFVFGMLTVLSRSAVSSRR